MFNTCNEVYGGVRFCNLSLQKIGLSAQSPFLVTLCIIILHFNKSCKIPPIPDIMSYQYLVLYQLKVREVLI